MTFIETLNHLIAGNGNWHHEQSIEIYIKQQLPTIFNFIFKDMQIETDSSFYIRKNSDSCLVHLQNNTFEMFGVYSKHSDLFKCEIRLNLQKRVIPTVICYFNDYFQLLKYEFDSNFGQFGFEHTLHMNSVRFSDESRRRKFYLKHNKENSVIVLEHIDDAVHKVDRNFDKTLSQLLLLNFRKPDVYQDAFNYLPSINLNDSIMTIKFINELSSRYYKNDRFLKSSLELITMYEF